MDILIDLFAGAGAIFIAMDRAHCHETSGLLSLSTSRRAKHFRSAITVAHEEDPHFSHENFHGSEKSGLAIPKNPRDLNRAGAGAGTDQSGTRQMIRSIWHSFFRGGVCLDEPVREGWLC